MIQVVVSYFYWLVTSFVVCMLILVIFLREGFMNPPLALEAEGLPDHLLTKLPTKTLTEEITCGICLENVVSGEQVKVLPVCEHKFHPECIDNWLRRSPACPYCRRPVSPQDLSF